MKAQQIREIYREYFVRHGHKAVPSDALIPKSDPTLLFTSAGMVQFKDYFLGKMGDALKRATSCQKCFRTTDIDSVGYTARHHTFFEMLGNFSFGDYFKHDAILWAWELTTQAFGLPKDRLWVSVFRDDDEAAQIWHREAGVPEDRILRFGEDENFWTMGDTGPCGPCSEIYYDMGGEGAADPVKEIEAGTDRYLEFWNLVFTQFDRQADGSLEPLPRKNVDTGMGLERIAAILQGVSTNYYTDLFVPIIRHVESISGRALHESPEAETALKVIGDHSRAALFAITDHITPSNEGRGYVLRRIVRRAIRFARKIGIEKNFFQETMAIAAEVMGKEYPEVRQSLAFAQRIATREEESFRATLERGMNLLRELIDKAKAEGRKQIVGAEVFRLYDTFGFPPEITREILEEEGLGFSKDQYESEMRRQREQSQKAWKGSGEQQALHLDQLEGFEPTRFLGYDAFETEAAVLAVAEAAPGVNAVVLDRTPFYGESGGQVGDRGRLEDPASGAVFLVENTQKTPAGVALHLGRFESGTFEAGARIRAEVEPSYRLPIMKNHTATHLLHAALREVLGDHVKQAGSKVAPDELRFDYTHFEAPTGEQLNRVETLVNRWIAEGHPLETEETSIDEARQRGAMALFGEKYGERVRMVAVPGVSLELCGGTHVGNTQEIGLFSIASDSSIASGIRRIVALSGPGAVEALRARDRLLGQTAAALKVAPEAVPERVEKLLEEVRALKKELGELKKEQMAAAAGDLKSQVRDVNGVPVLAAQVEAEDVNALRTAMDQVRAQLPPAVICLGAVSEGKVSLLCSVDDRWTGKAHAGKIIQAIAPIVGGRGGGKADRAQGGGTDPGKLAEALEKVYSTVGGL